MLFLSLSLQHTWAQCVESEWQPRASHGLSSAHRRICPKRDLYMYVYVCICKQIYMQGLFMLFFHTNTHTHTWAQREESKRQPWASHGLSVAHNQIRHKRPIYTYIYVYMYMWKQRTRGLFMLCLHTHTQTHTCAHTHTHLEHSVEKANVSLKRVTGYQLLTAKYVKRESYKRPIYAVSLHAHTHTHTWAQYVESERQPRASHGLSIAHSHPPNRALKIEFLGVTHIQIRTHMHTSLVAWVRRGCTRVWTTGLLIWKRPEFRLGCAIQAQLCLSETLTLVPTCQDMKQFGCNPAATNVSLWCFRIYFAMFSTQSLAHVTSLHVSIYMWDMFVHAYTHVFIYMYVCLWACMNA